MARLDVAFFDIYEYYGLKRGANSKALKEALQSKQGELRQKKDSKIGELNKELAEMDMRITWAIRNVKTEDKLAKYNKELDKAYRNGTLRSESQETFQTKMEEIERLYMAANYQGAIARCREWLNDKGANSKIYFYLAKCLQLSGDGEAALRTVDEFIAAYPDNYESLDLGVRFYIDIDDDIKRAQEYLNRILRNFGGSGVAVADQVYIHLAEENIEMAFKEIDSYIAANPTDQSYRETTAYDLIAFCDKRYIKEVYDGVEMAFLMSNADCQLCKQLADKAASVYHDETIQSYLDYAYHMGETEFNRDNIPNIGWTVLASACYLIGGIMNSQVGGEGSALLLLIGIIGLACAGMLAYVSNRPYWQIYKYQVTGIREPLENVFIIVGNVISAVMRLQWWLAKAIMRMVFGFAFR